MIVTTMAGDFLVGTHGNPVIVTTGAIHAATVFIQDAERQGDTSRHIESNGTIRIDGYVTNDLPHELTTIVHAKRIVIKVASVVVR